jgi:hypothetical protein
MIAELINPIWDLIKRLSIRNIKHHNGAHHILITPSNCPLNILSEHGLIDLHSRSVPDADLHSPAVLGGHHPVLELHPDCGRGAAGGQAEEAFEELGFAYVRVTD